jgi:hypothetical protein
MKRLSTILALLLAACGSKEYEQANKTFCAATEAALSEGELYYLADLKDAIPNAGPYTDGRGPYAVVVGMSGDAQRVPALIRLEQKPDVTVGRCFTVAKIRTASDHGSRRWLETKCPEPRDDFIYVPPL